MNLYLYNSLFNKERELHIAQKELIIETLKQKGKVSYRMTQAEAEKFEEEFPIVTTVYGKNDICNLGITDVYLVAHQGCETECSIYVDGIDTDTEENQKEFYIYPEQYSDVLYFLTYAAIEDLSNIAKQIAERQVVNNLNIAYSELFNKNGLLKSEYTTTIESIQKDIFTQLKDFGELAPKKKIKSSANIVSWIHHWAGDLAVLSLLKEHKLSSSELRNKLKNEYSGDYESMKMAFSNKLEKILDFDAYKL